MADLPGWLDRILKGLPILKDEKSPNLAALLGFLFGGIGLGLYFLSFVDFLIPVGIGIALTIASKAVANADPWTGLLAGALISAVYGAIRAQDSNERLRGLRRDLPNDA